MPPYKEITHKKTYTKVDLNTSTEAERERKRGFETVWGRYEALTFLSPVWKAFEYFL